MLTKQFAMNVAARMLNGLAVSAYSETVDSCEFVYHVFVLANGKRETVDVWIDEYGFTHCEY